MLKKLSKLTICTAVSTIIGLQAHVVCAQDKINYVGSSTVGKFMYEAEKVYTKATFNINTKPESGGGERAVALGKTDIGGVARDVKAEILNQGVKKFLIGKDAIGAWVNINNPINSLSTQQIKNIFSGKISNWKEVGGDDKPITSYIVNPDSATRKVFNEKLLGGDRYGGKVRTTRPDSKVIDRVAADEGGIGHLSFALGDTHPKTSNVKKIKIDGHEASVNNSDYPVTRPLHLITKGEPQGAVKDFIHWSLADEGQKVVKKYFVGK